MENGQEKDLLPPTPSYHFPEEGCLPLRAACCLGSFQEWAARACSVLLHYWMPLILSCIELLPNHPGFTYPDIILGEEC